MSSPPRRPRGPLKKTPQVPSDGAPQSGNGSDPASQPSPDAAAVSGVQTPPEVTISPKEVATEPSIRIPLYRPPTPSPSQPLTFKKRSPGRPGHEGKGTEKEIAASRAAALKERADEISQHKREIFPLPTGNINWSRREACRLDVRLFNETYLSSKPGEPKSLFFLGWSDDQLVCMDRIQTTFLLGGKFALALPRGGGKTALCRAAMIWGTAYAHRVYPFLIGSAEVMAIASLTYIKAAWAGSKAFQQDFPEIAYPVLKLENRGHLARGQIFRSQSTHIEWGSDMVRYPTLQLSKEDAKPYLDNCPEDFMIWLPDYECYITKSSGCILQVAGVDGSIRGKAGTHPLLLSQPRPDVVLLDDLQKDTKVDSEDAINKLIALIDGAIEGLGGPDQQLAALMPCTVIREGDVADTFVNSDKRPEWRGERRALVLSWPPGIDNYRLTLDTPAGRAWNEYDVLRKRSMKKHGDARLANDYYFDNREVRPRLDTMTGETVTWGMDENFVCSWVHRFDPKLELSAQQSAMNKRLDVKSAMFAAEFQNIGRKPKGEGVIEITAEELREKVISLPKRTAPIDTHSLVAWIDIQNEMLFVTIYASAHDFTGVFTDYFGYPEPFTRNFRRSQTEDWSLLSRMFFEKYPHMTDKAEKTRHGMRAPLEGKIYNALNECIRYLLTLSFVRDDPFKSPLYLQRIGIDTRWGKAADTIKRFIRDWSAGPGQATQSLSQVSGYHTRDILVPYFGAGITPQMNQYESMTRTRGWVFEDDICPAVREVKWIWKPDDTGQYRLMVDVNRMKSFLFQRLATPLGMKGSACLYNASPEDHEMFTNQICKSEYPETIINETRTLKKEMWKEREGVAFDNEYLDGATGCMALTSFNGCFLRHSDQDLALDVTPQPRMSEQWRRKKGA